MYLVGQSSWQNVRQCTRRWRNCARSPPPTCKKNFSFRRFIDFRLLAERTCQKFIFRSTVVSRPIKVGLKCSVHPSRYVCTSVHLSTKNSLDFNEIGHAGRVMHDGMQYDPIQGQGHEPFKVGNLAIFKSYLPAIYDGSWELTTDSCRFGPWRSGIMVL